MKVCFFSPYVPKHKGGGEKHLFDIAVEVATKHTVYIAVPVSTSEEIARYVAEYETFLGYSLASVTFITSPLFAGNFVSKTIWTRQFDYLYYVTDGSLFFSLARINNVHIQIPFTTAKNSVLDRLKFANWQIKNANSNFTKQVVEPAWKTKITHIVYPKVQIPQRIPVQKEKIILHVGRFFRQLHAKRQDVVVRLFRELCERHPRLLKDWKLVLVGQVEDKEYYTEIATAAKGYPITLMPNASHQQLKESYRAAQLYWHATGFGIDEQKEPEKVEHFGISTVEAMAYGVIPVVIKKGGQPEIVGNELTNLLWKSKEECIAITAELIANPKRIASLRQVVRERAVSFGEAEFKKRVWEMF
jgi:glycosyltransferase involved in cell wall biosynthesis